MTSQFLLPETEPGDWGALSRALVPANAASILPPNVQLPVLPKAMMEFTQKAQGSEVCFEELSKILATDSGLSGGLLRYANSAKSGLRNPITSVHQALVTLGVRTTQLFLTNVAVKQAMKSTSSKLINIQSFWNSNVERALLAREIAKFMKTDGDVAFTATMLQDFLLPLLTSQMLDDYLEFTEDRSSYATLVEFEQRRFGWDHAKAAASVMSAWKLPEELICCVFLHHHSKALQQHDWLRRSPAFAVALSAYVPDALRQEPVGLAPLLKLDSIWPNFSLLAVATSVDEEFQSIASELEGISNHFPFLQQVEKAMDRLALKSTV